MLPIPDHLVSCLDAIAGKASFNTVSAKQKCALSLGKQELPWTEHSKGASWDHSMPYPTGFSVASTTSVAVRSLHALASVPKSLPKSNQTSSVCIISHWWVSCLYQISSNTISSYLIFSTQAGQGLYWDSIVSSTCQKYQETRCSRHIKALALLTQAGACKCCVARLGKDGVTHRTQIHSFQHVACNALKVQDSESRVRWNGKLKQATFHGDCLWCSASNDTVPDMSTRPYQRI